LDFSLLIPTKDRVDILLDTIKFYIHKKYDGKIIIFDSSSDENANKLKKEISNLNLNFSIKIYNITALPFGAISVMSDNIDTQYVAFSGDDDYFIPENLKFFVNYLVDNPSYFGVNGNAVHLSKSDNSYTYQDINSYDQKELLIDDPNKRLNTLLENYKVPLFSIVRKNVFIDLIKYVPVKEKSKNLSRQIIDEILISCLYAISGKIKHLNYDHLIRIGHETNNKTYSFKDDSLIIKTNTYKFLKETLKDYHLSINKNQEYYFENIINNFLNNLSKYEIQNSKKKKFKIKSFIILTLKKNNIFDKLLTFLYRIKILTKINHLYKKKLINNKQLIKDCYLIVK